MIKKINNNLKIKKEKRKIQNKNKKMNPKLVE